MERKAGRQSAHTALSPGPPCFWDIAPGLHFISGHVGLGQRGFLSGFLYIHRLDMTTLQRREEGAALRPHRFVQDQILWRRGQGHPPHTVAFSPSQETYSIPPTGSLQSAFPPSAFSATSQITLSETHTCLPIFSSFASIVPLIPPGAVEMCILSALTFQG